MKCQLKFEFFVQEIAFETVVCEIAAILSRPQCVKINLWAKCYVGLSDRQIIVDIFQLLKTSDMRVFNYCNDYSSSQLIHLGFIKIFAEFKHILCGVSVWYSPTHYHLMRPFRCHAVGISATVGIYRPKSKSYRLCLSRMYQDCFMKEHISRCIHLAGICIMKNVPGDIWSP